MFRVLKALQLLLMETIFGQCKPSYRPENRASHAWISIISVHCVVHVQHWFQLFNRSQIFIGILVFRLGNVTSITQGNISHMSFLAFLSLVLEEKEVLYCFVTSRKDLRGDGGTRRPTSVVLIQSSKHYKELYEDSHWFMYNVLSREYWGVSNWSSVTTLASSFLSQSIPPFLPLNEACIATDLSWTGIGEMS